MRCPNPAHLLACLITLLPAAAADEGPWITLFDGRTLDGWKASENKNTFKVVDGVIVADGKRSHLFYVGPEGRADFTDFELTCDVLTKPGANSGIFFHTEYQEEDWPAKGYEIQINNTQSDWRRTGSLYGIVDRRESPVKDNTWFTVRIRVHGKRIQAWINDQETIDYIEAENPEREGRFAGRVLNHGTIALQGHDPDSVVHFRNIKLRVIK